jgi:hypothetical protein
VAFTCSVCGVTHAGETRDVRAGLPQPIFRLEEDERNARAYVEDDFAVLYQPDGARHFVRGLLRLPIEGEEDGYFAYGAWVEVSKEDVIALGELWDDAEGWRVEPFSGSLANELTPYSRTEGLPALLRLREVNLLPLVELAEGEHELVAAQREGISAHRAHELASVVS